MWGLPCGTGTLDAIYERSLKLLSSFSIGFEGEDKILVVSRRSRLKFSFCVGAPIISGFGP